MYERLTEIQKREKAATEGDWWALYLGESIYDFEVLDHEGCDVWPWIRREDMEFAYKARQDIPYLLNLIESLREEKEKTKKCVD